MPSAIAQTQYPFLQGGGEMGFLTRTINWSDTALGTPDQWPQSLRTTLGIVLHSAFPMVLFWGDDLLCFYNDAFRPSLGNPGKHPAIGQKGESVWAEIWDFVGPLIHKVQTTGEAVWYEDKRVPVHRNGRLEDVYWTFSYSPVFGDDDSIAGVMATVIETTQKETIVEQLTANEEYFHQITDTVPAIIWKTRADGYCNYLNKQWYDVTGQSAQEAEGLGWLNATHPDDKADSERLFVEANEKQTAFNCLYRLRQRNGSYRWVIDKGTPQFNDAGDYLGMIGTVVDVHEQKLAEAETRQFASIIEASHEFVGLATPDGQALYLNPAAQTMLGWSTIEGKQIIDCIYPDDRPLAETLLKESCFSHEIRFVNAQTNAPIWMQWNAFTITDPVTGELTGLATVSPNISEQKQAQLTLQESEARFRTMAEDANILIAMSDETGRTTYLNQAWQELTGRSVADLLDRGWVDLVHPDDREPFLNQLVSALQQQKSFTGEFRILNTKGEYSWLLVRCPARFRPDGSFAGYISSSIDITERKKAEEALQASEAKIRMLIQEAPVATMLMTGPNHVIELANETMITMLGKGPSIIGKPSVEAVPELAVQAFLGLLNDVFTNGVTHRANAMPGQLVNNGVTTQHYFDFTYKPMRTATGEIYGVLSMAADVTEQVMARRELEQQKQYLQNALDIANLGTFHIDAATNICTYTETIRQWFGLDSLSESKEVILSKVHADDRLNVLRTLTRSLEIEAESRHDITYRIADAAGKTIRHLRSIGKVLHDEGKPYAIDGIMQDVTFQIQAQQAIRESEQHLRVLVESAPFPIGVYVGREMRIQFANQSILAAWGKGNDVIGKLFREVMPELGNQKIFEQLDQVFTTGVPFHAKNQPIEVVVEGKRQPYYFNYNLTPLYNADGQIYGVMNTAAEVTDLVLAKQKLEQTEATLRGAIELAELGTWEMDVTTGRITYSDRIKSWFGFTDEMTTLSTVYNPIHEKDRNRIEEAIKNVLSPGSSGIYDEEYSLIDSYTGKERIVHAQGIVFFDSFGNPIKLSGTAQDITEQRRRQHELERQVQERTEELEVSNASLATSNDELAEFNQLLKRSNDNLQQFAYVASHDLQEPLRKIQSFGDLLRSQYADQLDDGADLLNRMQLAAARMSVLIKDLLTYSRISTRQEITAPVPLNEIVQRVMNDLELSIEETKARLTVDPLPTVLGDQLQLGQLFQNLISNALKFRKADNSGRYIPPVITITSRQVEATEMPSTVNPTRHAPAYHRIDVSDNGIGFDEKYAERIFQVFQRLHGRSEFAGTGIGLAICEKVAVNHGGAITASSRPGQGATFSIYLPV